MEREVLLSIIEFTGFYWIEAGDMKGAIFFGALTLLCAFLAYFLNFNEWAGLSDAKGDWGVFGDFIGGVSNPVLTFITMCLLIRSLMLQKDANQSIIEQNLQIKDAGVRQREMDELRSFESTFYSLAEAARQEYCRLKVTDLNGVCHLESYAVSYIEEEILRSYEIGVQKGETIDLAKAFNELDEKSSMAVFSVVRGVYILVKIVSENCPSRHKQKYLDVCIHILPVKLLNLVCLARAYADWDILDFLQEEGFFDKKGLEGYLHEWLSLKG